ncbi:putative ribonuclease H protein [Nymphaea thermarum]|nr:putative ribonuclease H protein [Nymphaea thermarum]
MKSDDTNEDPTKSSFTTKDISSPQDHTDRGRVQLSYQSPRNDTTTRSAKGKGIIRDVTKNHTSMVNPFYQTECLPSEIPHGFSFTSSPKHNPQAVAKAPYDGQEDVHNDNLKAGTAGGITHSRGRGSRLAGHRKSAQDTTNRSFVDPKPSELAGKRKRVSHCRVEGSSDIAPPSQTNDISNSGSEDIFTSGPEDHIVITLFKRLGVREFMAAPWEELDKVQSLEMASTVNDMNYEKLLREELQASLEEEVNLWRQRARVRWLAEGDHNTAYYQAIVKSRRTKNSLSALEHERLRINDVNRIRSLCDDFFCALLSSEVGSGCCLNKRADHPRLLLEDNATLLLPATLDEVKRVVFSMKGNSAPGPDGFPASFYQQHWSIVGHDLQQSNICFKIDFSKAYDRVNWVFLKNALIDVGFSLQWVDRVMMCVSSASFAVLIDGGPGDFHPMRRGLRPGDPMSLYLFLVVMEELSRNLEYRCWNGNLKPPYIPWVGACPSLLTFADDLIIFSRGEHRSYNEVTHALEALNLSSGLIVNPHKSHAISFGEQRAHLSFISNSDWLQGSLPLTYLGVFLFVGNMHDRLCASLILKVEKKLSLWSSILLSYAGRLCLIRYVLLSLIGYWCSVFMLPKSIQHKLEVTMANFLWGSQEARKGAHLVVVAWKTLCRPMLEGGVGLKLLTDWNKACIGRITLHICQD